MSCELSFHELKKRYYTLQNFVLLLASGALAGCAPKIMVDRSWGGEGTVTIPAGKGLLEVVNTLAKEGLIPATNQGQADITAQATINCASALNQQVALPVEQMVKVVLPDACNPWLSSHEWGYLGLCASVGILTLAAAGVWVVNGLYGGAAHSSPVTVSASSEVIGWGQEPGTAVQVSVGAGTVEVPLTPGVPLGNLIHVTTNSTVGIVLGREIANAEAHGTLSQEEALAGAERVSALLSVAETPAEIGAVYRAVHADIVARTVGNL